MVVIPRLETERLVLRAPRADDFQPFMDFYATERSKFVGGPRAEAQAMASFGHMAGLWVTHGYSFFVVALRDAPDASIGALGAWQPVLWPEPELGWTLWDARYEGKGYVTEAMMTLIPWAYDTTGVESFVSYIERDNTASVRVAGRLGASFDPEATRAANLAGAPFHVEDGPQILVYRHRKSA